MLTHLDLIACAVASKPGKPPRGSTSLRNYEVHAEGLWAYWVEAESSRRGESALDMKKT